MTAGGTQIHLISAVSAHGAVYVDNVKQRRIIMSEKLLKKLSSIIANPESSKDIDPAGENRLNTVLDDHLDVIAAAHTSSHGSNHASTPDLA